MLIYAHRGASAEFPEGSLAAYKAAITQGADGFECDVRLTKDLQIICYHDANTKRLTGIELEIAKTDYEQLKKSANPLLFTELLDLAIKNKKHLAIETKHPTPTGGLIEKELHKKLLMHVHGINEEEYIKKVEGLDNEEKIKIRKRLSRSNKDLFSSLLRHTDKIFTAKG